MGRQRAFSPNWEECAIERIFKNILRVSKCGGDHRCRRCGDTELCANHNDCRSAKCLDGICHGDVVVSDITNVSACVQTASNTPAVDPEPEPGYEDPGAALSQKDAYRGATDCKAINLDALLLSGFLCHPCLPNPCENGAPCENIDGFGFHCDCARISAFGDVCQFAMLTPSPTLPVSLAPTQNTSTRTPSRAAPFIQPMVQEIGSRSSAKKRIPNALWGWMLTCLVAHSTW